MLRKVWGNWDPCALLVEIRNGAASMENNMVVPQLKIELLYDQQFHFWVSIQKNQKQRCRQIFVLPCSQQHLLQSKGGNNPSVHGQKNEWTKCDTHIPEMLFSMEREGHSDTCPIKDEAWRHDAKRNKPVTQRTNIVWFHFCEVPRIVKFIKAEVEGWLPTARAREEWGVSV